jgi:hypothetical protein
VSIKGIETGVALVSTEHSPLGELARGRPQAADRSKRKLEGAHNRT